MKWHAASLQELTQIIRNEDCPLVYKCFAETELENRLRKYGFVYEL
ncbi:hypothetical protein [Priestia flexa]|nr:hypothetical protein [Priestia flexa]